MREYETTIIVAPEISEEGTSAVFERLGGILERSDAIRLMCEDLGKRKLAYEIRKFHKGHYYILSYLDDGKVVPELERALRIDESVLRFMTIQESPHVADIEARRAAAQEAEIEQTKRAADRAAREAEEARARAEAEAAASQELAARAEAEAAAAEEAPAAEPSEAAGAEAAEPSTQADPQSPEPSAETEQTEEAKS